MKNKPISEGYKVMALRSKGYCYTFEMVSRVVTTSVPKVPNLSATGCIVAYLCSKLPKKQFNVFMDNYFSSIPLFEHLRSAGIGACGTAQSNSAKYPKQMRFRNDKTKKHDWNTIKSMSVGNVLVIFWMDNGPVQLLSPIHDVVGSEWLIERERKRPRITSTNGASMRKQFGDSVRKTFAIPRCVDDYNHFMNGVDVTDQYRAYYKTQLIAYRTWMPIFFWLLDTTIINTFIYYQFACARIEKTALCHRAFRQNLAWQLISKSPKTSEDPVQRMHLSIFRQQRIQCAVCIKRDCRGLYRLQIVLVVTPELLRRVSHAI
ncbi:O-methyltransferase [Phytophthora palmivora]|uniref:O-methyltransferase n=1 Tax=Phytophthora palmivora TaxID=4796 RepID=A0A2P4Y0T0_9STRA|nr:O-methyltransferase [Phytophthora palmivora]